MKPAVFLAALSLAVIPLTLSASEEVDFFAVVEGETVSTNAPQETDINYDTELDYRIHYAPQDQTQAYNFRRASSGIVSSRADAYGALNYTPNERFSIKLSASASYDSKRYHKAFQSELDESYAYWNPVSGWYFTIGRQLMVFGEADYFRILDVINPLDERVLGLAELDEIRLPTFGSRISYTQNRWGIDIFLLHEFRSSEADESRGDFDPFIHFGGSESVIIHKPSSPSLSNPNWGGRLFLSRPWGDISLVMAHTRNYQATPTGITNSGMFIAEYPEIKTQGLSVNYVWSNWLFKTELGVQDDLKIMRNDIAAQLATPQQSLAVYEDASLRKAMIGGRYSGINDLVFGLELYREEISNHNSLMISNRIDIRSAFNISYELMNDKLKLALLLVRWQSQDSDLVRMRIEYEYQDNTILYAGYITYSAENQNSLLYPFEKNDRIYFGLTYNY